MQKQMRASTRKLTKHDRDRSNEEDVIGDDDDDEEV